MRGLRAPHSLYVRAEKRRNQAVLEMRGFLRVRSTSSLPIVQPKTTRPSFTTWRRWRTLRRSRRTHSAERSPMRIERRDGEAATIARRRRGLASVGAAIGRTGVARGLARRSRRSRREWASPAKAQLNGRRPTRPFAAVAAPEGLGLSHSGRRTRRPGQRDAARHSATEGPDGQFPSWPSLRSADPGDARGCHPQSGGAAHPRMERQA